MPIFRTPFTGLLNIPGCVLWFDAADTRTMTFSDNTITSWRSKGSATVSTNVVAGGFTNPTYTTYNSLPAVEFNGTSTYIQTGNVSVPGTGTTWITCSVNLTPVTASTPVDSSVVLATESPSEKSIRYIQTGGNSYYAINSNVANTVTFLRGKTNENANGIRGFMDTSAFFTGFTNGTQTVSNTTALNYLPTVNQPFLMGKWASGFLNGYIYESLVYNRVLTLTEYRQVEGYLAQKWGFTGSLPVGHPGLGTTINNIIQLSRLPYYRFFNPQTISSLALWLDAADSSTVSGTSPITAWTDKSSAGRTVTITSGPTYGTTTRNGLKTMYFNNNVISSSIASAVGTGDFTLIAAWYQSSAGTNTVLSLGTVASSSQSLGYSGNKYNFYQYGSLESAYTTGPGWVVQVGTRISSIKRVYITGTIGSVPASDSFNVSDTTVTIGKGDNFAITGEIAEIMVYTGTMSDISRQLLESYLAQKWGTTASLPGDHLNVTQPAGAITLTALTNFRILSRSRGSPITSTTLNTIATYLRNYMSEFRNPSFYGYNLDGNSYYINDGGGDMYDGGNWTYPWLISGTQYTNANGNSQQAFSINYSSTTATTVDTDFVYASLGYAASTGTTITSNHPLTVLGFRTSTGTPVGFQLGGNSGADGGGTLASGILYAGDIIQGFTVHAFYRETYNAGDPSHCNLFILLGHPSWISVFGTISSFADPVANGGNGCFFYTSGAGVSNILAIQTLLSKSGGVLVTAAECQTVVQAFVNRVKLAVGF